MAYQPKSYRKFLAGTVTAAVVASAIAPAASAAFTDVAANDTHAKNIDKAVQMGLINGYPDGTFGTYQDITRGQVAKIIARYLGNVDTSGVQQFDDVAKSPDAELKAAALKVRAAGVFTGSDGNLNAGKNITRQEMASVVARLFGLTDKEGVESSVTDNDKAWEVHRENINLLSEYGITTEYTFNPLANVKRGQFASFIVRAIDLANPVDIVKVTALDATGRYVEINFNKPVVGLEAADIQITDAKTGARKGVKDVKLSSNGQTATVELFAVDDNVDILPVLRDYTVKVYYQGETLQYTFNRPAFTEGRVADINVADKEFVVYNNDTNAKVTVEIAGDTEFDYQAALGEIVRVWYNKDNELVNFVIDEASAKYDAIEITKADEIKLISEDKKYDISEEEYKNSSTDKFKFYLNGEEVEIGDEVKVGDKFNFAKVGFDRSGDVEYISAYNFKEFLVVKEVKGDEVVGYEGNGTGAAFDAEDATIIKDGKVITLADLEKGDVLFFNEDADGKDGFAEVLNNSVTGEIESVYDESIKVDGKVYDFVYDQAEIKKYGVSYASGAVYVDKDGKTAVVDNDAAEELQAAGDVTLYFDRAGNLVYIAGDLAEVESNTKTSILTSDIVGYTQARDRVEIEALTSEGNEELFDINLKDLDTITIDGKDYDIDNEDTKSNNEKYVAVLADGGETLELYQTVADSKDAEVDAVASIDLTKTKGQAVKLKLSDSGSLKEIEFFDAANTNKEGSDVLDEDEVLEPGDTYFKAVSGSKLLKSNTVVFDISDDTTGFDADDVEISTWGEYKGSDIDEATVIYDEDNEAIAIVITKTTTADTVYEEAVITNVLRDTDKKIVEISAFVNGKEETFKVDKVDNQSLDKGQPAVLQFSKSNKELVKGVATDGEYSDRVETFSSVKDVNVGTGEVTLERANGTTEKFKLVNNGLVIDAKDKNDLDEKSLSDLRGKKNVTVVLDERTGSFAKFFVYGTQPTTETPATGSTTITLDKDVYVVNENALVKLKDASLNVDPTKSEIVKITTADNIVITLEETSSNSGEFIGSVALTKEGTFEVKFNGESDTAKVISEDEAAATSAVEKAETSKTQEDVDAAQTLVDALPAGDAKTALQTRLDAIEVTA